MSPIKEIRDRLNTTIHIPHEREELLQIMDQYDADCRTLLKTLDTVSAAGEKLALDALDTVRIADTYIAHTEEMARTCQNRIDEVHRLRNIIGALPYGTWNRIGNRFGDGTAIGKLILETCYALADISKEQERRE